MRILQVNKFHYPRGGADKYYLDLGAALEKAGHEVAYFSMKHPKNVSSVYDKYFVSRISFNEGGLRDKLLAPGRMIYSLEAKRKFKKLITDFKPDIIHIHNIYHQLSPSILDVARLASIPVVMHLHDYKLICPNYQLFAHGQICEDCKPNHYFVCAKKRCFKNSFSKSLLAALEMTIHHRWLKIYYRSINTFIAPSAFMKSKVVEFGWPAEKIKVILNPFSSVLRDIVVDAPVSNYLLYFGRLSPEKGLNTLLEAATLTKSELKFAGVGPEENSLRALAASKGVKVDFLGFKEGQELKEIIMGAQAIVLPSIWYENMPLSLLEALSLGKPVIASEIGGMPEMIINGKNGWLFKPGDAQDLAAKIKLLAGANYETLAQNATASVANLGPKENLAAVLKVYTELKK